MVQGDMPVGNLGPDGVVTTDPNTPVIEATDILESENVGSVVVTENDEPVGLVTDRDIALAVDEDANVATEPVETVMTNDPVTLQEDQEAMEVSRTIEEHEVRRIPVVDENGDLTGIVTLDDLVAAMGEQLDNVANTIERQSPGYRP